MFTGGAVDSKAPVTVNCSSHWFDAKDGVAAVGWYEQGVRFLDYRTPTDITAGRLLHPGRTARPGRRTGRRPTRTGEIVYTADAYRGVDVLQDRQRRHSPARRSRRRCADEWFGSPARDSASFQPHPIFGFVCPVLKAGVSLP